jgi:hypothetical protein|tara:strand:- start:321 stop:659 length:339 start_codon:yes stop_codon:yes gene_type:complete
MKIFKTFIGFIKESLNEVKQRDTAAIASRLSDAISKIEGVDVSVTKGSLDSGGFDLDYDGKEFEGGSYFIGDSGEIVNAATGLEIYGNMSDSVDDLVKNIKKGKFKKYKAIE